MPFEHEDSSDSSAPQSSAEAGPLGSRPAVGARHANPAEALGSDSGPVGPGGGDFLGLNQEVRPGSRGQSQYSLQQESVDSAPEGELELAEPLAVDAGEGEDFEAAQPVAEAELQPAPALPKAPATPVAAAPARRSPVLMLCLVGFSVGILGAVALPFLDDQPAATTSTEVASAPAPETTPRKPVASPKPQAPTTAPQLHTGDLASAQPNASSSSSTSSNFAAPESDALAAPAPLTSAGAPAHEGHTKSTQDALVASAAPELPGAFAKEVLVLSELAEADLRAAAAPPTFDLPADELAQEAVAAALEPLPPAIGLESELESEAADVAELEAGAEVHLVQAGPAMPPAASASSATSAPDVAVAPSEAGASTAPATPVAASEIAATPAPAPAAPVVATPAQPATAQLNPTPTDPTPAAPAQAAPSNDLAMIWQADTVPFDKIGHGARVLTPSVGNVRVAMASNDYFEGKLYAVGQHKVWLDTSTGRIELKGSEVKAIERILSTPAELGDGDAPLPGEWVRVKTRGGTIYGKLIGVDGTRVTIETPERARITLDDAVIEPARPPKEDERQSGGSKDKPKKLTRPKPKKK
jgi:hypothetical protein